MTRAKYTQARTVRDGHEPMGQKHMVQDNSDSTQTENGLTEKP